MIRFTVGIAGALLFLLTTPMAAQAQALGDLVDESGLVGMPRIEQAGKTQTTRVGLMWRDGAFSGLAVELGTSEPSLEVAVRFPDTADSDTWHAMAVVPSATGGTAIAGYLSADRFESNRAELRVVSDSEAQIVVRDVGVFDAINHVDTQPAPPQAPLVGRKDGDVVPPPLITRAEWGAEPFRGSPVNLASPSYDYMTWHHAAGYSAETLDEGKAQMRAMQDLHQNVRGWSDIGYQFGIDRGGRLYQGRPFMDNSTSLSQVPVLARGAHVGGANTGNIGVVIMGCYHPPEGSRCEQEITPAAFATYVNLFAFLSERYGVEPRFIRGHRDFSATSCPGDNNYALIPELISQVSTVLITGNEPLGEATMSGSVDGDGVVNLSWAIGADFGIESLLIERITEEGTSVLSVDPSQLTSFTDGTLAGPTEVTYVLIATGTDGRRQELARIELDLGLPDNFLMTSAFPNPSTDRFEIRYFLATEGEVTLTMHNARGQLVAEAPEGFSEGEQWVAHRFDTSTLASGVYYVRLRVKSFSGTAFDRTIPVVVVD